MQKVVNGEQVHPYLRDCNPTAGVSYSGQWVPAAAYDSFLIFFLLEAHVALRRLCQLPNGFLRQPIDPQDILVGVPEIRENMRSESWNGENLRKGCGTLIPLGPYVLKVFFCNYCC